MPVGIDPYELIGNPQLSPETNHQLDLNIAYRNEKTMLEINTYTSLVNNYISSVIRTDLRPRISTSPGVRQFINISEATLYGFEFSWMQDWTGVIREHFNINYTHGTNRDNGNPLPEIAPLNLRYRISARLNGEQLQPYAQFRYVADQKRVAPEFGERSTAAFRTLDLGRNWKPVEQLQLSTAVQNIFKEAYREHLSRFISAGMPLNAPGRNVTVTVAYQF